MRLITSPISGAEFHEIWEHKHPGTVWATPGLLRNSFTFFFYIEEYKKLATFSSEVVRNEKHGGLRSHPVFLIVRSEVTIFLNHI